MVKHLESAKLFFSEAKYGISKSNNCKKTIVNVLDYPEKHYQMIP